MVRRDVYKKGRVSPLPEQGTKSAKGSPKPEADLEVVKVAEDLEEVKSPKGEVTEETE